MLSPGNGKGGRHRYRNFIPANTTRSPARAAFKACWGGMSMVLMWNEHGSMLTIAASGLQTET
jgi:hypothetical protein